MARSPARKNIDQHFFQLIAQPEDDLRVMERLMAPRPSRRDRLSAGKAMRQAVPRSMHAHYRSTENRTGPVETILAENARRIPHLVPHRMARMAASPFAFLRGSAALMAADLSGSPVTGLQVMACGDMHVANFGLFGSAERNLIFAINDFDEAYPAPWEWDLKRLAASAAVAAIYQGGDRRKARDAAHACVRNYVRQIRRYADMGFLEVWYDLIDEEMILRATPPELMKGTLAAMAKARSRGRQQVFERMTEVVAGQPRLLEDIPLVVRETHLSNGKPIIEALSEMLVSYVRSLPDDRIRLLSRYRVIDVARKVVGVGSVGTSCWVVLLQGVDAEDPLLLQVKEAGPSVLEPFAPSRFPVANQGQRVVYGQRMIQGSPDIFLGWGGAMDGGGGRDFYIRQLADMKGAERFEHGASHLLNRLEPYCGLCGWALALAHAKSGDAAMIAGYCGRSEALADAISQFAMAYLEQTDRDHDALLAAIRSGRIAVAPGADGDP